MQKIPGALDAQRISTGIFYKKAGFFIFLTKRVDFIRLFPVLSGHSRLVGQKRYLCGAHYPLKTLGLNKKNYP